MHAIINPKLCRPLFLAAAILLLAVLVAPPSLRAASPDIHPDYQALARSSAPPAEKLHQLFELYWRRTMEEHPEAATYNGFPGQNDRWTDYSLPAIARRKARAGDPLEVLKTIDRSALSPADQLNYDLFRREIEQEAEATRFPRELLPINQMGGVQQEIAQTLSIAPKLTLQDYEDMVARLERAPRLIEQTRVLLELGAAQGITPPRVTLRDVPNQIASQIAPSAAESPLFSAFTEFPPGIPEPERQRLRSEAAQAIESGIMPAYRELLEYFNEDYLPKTREETAISALPQGKDWYLFNVRRRTTTSLTPSEIHEIGLSEVRRIRAKMEEIIQSTGFEGTFAEFAKFLRTDPRFFYTEPEDLLAGYRDIAKRADLELPKLFGKLPRLPYGVLPIPAYKAKSTTTAYYQPGSINFGRAGVFFANTYDLASRPKWEMEALTFHEAVPGHHLQIALSQEMEGVPEFRKHSESTVFVEGWGLYSEQLGDEMGFYTDPYSKFGQLTYEMWRAIRLVVDTGMHALGWSRQRAIDFFKENAPKAEHDIIVEIDRYIVWPGQALAYKIGELKIRELRARAEKELGRDFDIRAFHDELLSEGALPLDILEARMNAWIAAQKG